MYGDLDLCGWYTASGAVGNQPTSVMRAAAADEPTADDLRVHQDVVATSFCENPLLLLLNPHSEAAAKKKKIPYFLYDSERFAQKFNQLNFLFASSDSEQIAVDGCAQAVDPDAKLSHTSQKMTAPINSVQILRGKINFIIAAVKNSKEVR